jgi:hypothetical protein
VASQASAADLINFWDDPQYGGNSFNRLPPDQAYFEALRGYGATWVRLSYDKWDAEGRDFLLGNADRYEGLTRRDLATLRATLDRANKAGLKVVIAPLSLPGMRWAQNNGQRFDGRLWKDKAYWTQAAAFLRDLASELKDHPAVAAYNIVNEPAPEKENGLAEHAGTTAMRAWYARHEGTAADLPAFYEMVIAAIRDVDPLTPIMADAGWYGAADSFSYWPNALSDKRVLYAFHMYEPYAAIGAPNFKREKPFQYPGTVPYADGSEPWDADRVAAYVRQPFDWAATKDIPSNRVVAGEFGCMRRMAFCRLYLEDVLSALDGLNAHWAFYSFREDSWDGMDYELGSGKVNWKYWDAIESGTPDPVMRSPTVEFEPIGKRLGQPR